MNDRQKAFADYYIECGNAAEAARKAGYSANTARQMGKENLTKPYILEYIRKRTAPTEQKRIASGDDVLRFFTRVMDGDEGADMPDRISAGREILKRDVSDRKLEIELLKLENNLTMGQKNNVLTFVQFGQLPQDRAENFEKFTKTIRNSCTYKSMPRNGTVDFASRQDYYNYLAKDSLERMKPFGDESFDTVE